MTLKGLKGPLHVGRSNIAVPSIYKEVHGLAKNKQKQDLPVTELCIADPSPGFRHSDAKSLFSLVKY